MRCGFANDIVEILDELPRGITLVELEYCFLSMLYSKLDGNKTHCAKEAGICLRSMQKKVKEMEYYGYYVAPMGKRAVRGKSRYRDSNG